MSKKVGISVPVSIRGLDGNEENPKKRSGRLDFKGKKADFKQKEGESGYQLSDIRKRITRKRGKGRGEARVSVVFSG